MFYRVNLTVKKDNQIVDEYSFTDESKEKLYTCATSWFHGYIRAIGDFSRVKLSVPYVPSMDGYQAWSGNNYYTIRLTNANGDIVTDINSII